MADWTLTAYGDDDSTPVWEIGTSASHANPYLQVPDEVAEAEIDLLRGQAHIGQANLGIIDPQTGATQDIRWLTARLGTSDGFSALNRRRMALRRDGSTVMDGVVGGATLNDSFAGYTIPLRDIRERGRKVPAFNRAATSSVWPRGVINGYGSLPGGGWLVPPVVPIRGVFVNRSFIGLGYGEFLPDGAPRSETATVDPRLILTDAMRQAAVPTAGYHDRVRILWRPEFGGAWNVLERMAAAAIPAEDTASGLFVVRRGRHRGETVDAVAAVRLNAGIGTGHVLPTNNQRVELIVGHDGPPSEQYPLHWEGSWGEAVAKLLDGDWSARPNGSTIDPRIRYDAAAVAAIADPVRLRVTKPIEDIRTALEQFCAAVGAAPALDAAGAIAPVRYAMPDAAAVLPQIDDSNAAAIAGWEHPTNNAVTAVEVTYARDYYVSPDLDPEGRISGGDGIASREVRIRRQAEQAVLDVMGEQDLLEIDAWMFRAIGGPEGQPITGDVQNEAGHQLAEQRGNQAIDRFSYGGQVGYVRLMASDFAGLKVGDWVIDARSWVPNYLTGRRGGNALAQVVSLNTSDPAWWAARLDYASPSDMPVAAPTFGTPSVDADGVVTVPVLTAPAGYSVDVQYAVAASLPGANSGAWLHLDRIAASDLPGSVSSAALPAGAIVWLRGRTAGPGVRPSAWVAIGDVTVPQVPRIRSLTVTADGVVSWEVNGYTEGVRLYYGTHAADVDEPALDGVVDVAASVGWVQLPIDPAAEALTVEAEPWTGFAAGAVAGVAGQRVRRTASRFIDDAIRYALSAHEVRRTADSVTLEIECGPGIVAIAYWVRSWAAGTEKPTPTDSDPPHGLTLPGARIVVALPPAGQLRAAWFTGYDATAVRRGVTVEAMVTRGEEPITLEPGAVVDNANPASFSVVVRNPSRVPWRVSTRKRVGGLTFPATWTLVAASSSDGVTLTESVATVEGHPSQIEFLPESYINGTWVTGEVTQSPALDLGLVANITQLGAIVDPASREVLIQWQGDSDVRVQPGLVSMEAAVYVGAAALVGDNHVPPSFPLTVENSRGGKVATAIYVPAAAVPASAAVFARARNHAGEPGPIVISRADWSVSGMAFLLAMPVGTSVAAAGNESVRSMALRRRGGGWAHYVDGRQFTFNVSASAGPDAGIGASETWVMDLYGFRSTALVASLVLDPTSIPHIVTTVVVRGGSVTTGPQWSVFEVDQPALHDTVGEVTLQAVNVSGHSAKVYRDNVDITGDLSPSLTSAPTTSTAYAMPGLFPRTNGEDLASYTIRAEIIDGSSNVVWSEERMLQYPGGVEVEPL